MRYSDMIEGLQILAKYEDVDEPHLEGAEHDVVWAAMATTSIATEEHDGPIHDERLTTEDNERLRELGWFVDPEQEAWAHFC